MSESLLDVNLDDAKPFSTLSDNTEARLTITRAELTESKSQSPAEYNLQMDLSCERDDVEDIRVWIPVPSKEWKEQEPKSYQRAVNRFKEFTDAFGVRMPLNIAALHGLSGWALVSEEEDQRTGKQRNGVRRFIAPKA